MVDLLRDAKRVDQKVTDLAVEVEHLAGTCDLAQTQLEDVSASLKTDANWDRTLRDTQSTRLWVCVNAQIQECNKAIRSLAESISSVQRPRSGFIGKAKRQLQLNFKEAEIATIRSRISMSVSGLQLSLQAIIM